MAPKYQAQSWSACAKLIENYIESDKELKKWIQSHLFTPFFRAFWNMLRTQGSESQIHVSARLDSRLGQTKSS